jgi:outer membrane receptor for ferric coprogen and ferric-rhodotorulic acid
MRTTAYDIRRWRSAYPVLAIALSLAQPTHAAPAEDNAADAILVQGQRGQPYTAGEQSAAIGLPLTLRETPQTVTVLTRQLLDDQQIETIDDVLGTTPGVTSYANDNAGRTTYRARGFDITNYKIDGMQVDGQSNLSGGGASTNLDLYDNVQIVRGANGLLGGTGDPSATIYLQRKQPGTKLGANGMVTLGNWNKRRVMGDLNLPITAEGHVRARLVFSDESTDTFRDREHVGRRGILANVAADLGPRTLLNGGVQYERTRNDGASWGSNVSIWFADGTLANLPRSTNPVADWSLAKRQSTTAFITLDHSWGKDWHLRLGYARTEASAYNNLGIVKVNNAARNLGGFAGFWNQNGTGGFLNALHSEYESQRDNIDLSLSGSIHVLGRQHQLMFGVNGFSNRQTEYAFSGALGNCSIAGATPYSACQYRAAGLPIADWRTWDGSYANFATFRTNARARDTTRNVGGYAAGRFNLAKGLTAILGARVSDYKAYGGDYNIANVYTADAVTTHQKGVFTPYAGLVYDLTRNFSLYGSYTDMFTPQGNLRDAQGQLLDPVIGTSYEAGIKGAFYGGRLNTALAFYRNKQSNVAENTGALNDTTGEAIYRAVNGVISKGIDVDVSGELLPGWNMFFGYSYLDVKGLSYQQDPHNVLRMSTSYTLPGAWNRLTVGGGLSKQSSTQWSTNPGRPLGGGRYDATNLTVGGYTLANLMVRYAVTKQIQIAANVSNLTDVTYYRQYGFYDGLIYGEPRSYSVTLRARL